MIVQQNLLSLNIGLRKGKKTMYENLSQALNYLRAANQRKCSGCWFMIVWKEGRLRDD